uniref:Pro-apoptotic serine protease n=1 Tax=Talaromyces marneffei PM1 TaxID=1077442 RepID=A0A093VFT8_TALMA
MSSLTSSSQASLMTPAESSDASIQIDSSLKRDILKSMVQVAVRQTRSYQESLAGTYQASAFLVNKELGLFFTAAHAVNGPCEGYIISHNDERCDFNVKYRDPEHDYAILQCPPDALEALDLESLTLSPEKALVDTPSPRHFDSNVELIQASAAGKGGCSGGPLLTLSGEAIGICVSGHNNSHLDWFFPLQHPVHVLNDIVSQQPVSRGTIHTVWKRLPYYECRQLGLSREKQAEFDTDRNGLLVAAIIIPETEAFDFLQVNDILISINGRPMALFTELEELLDANVGRKIQVTVIRFGQELTFNLTVHDLLAIVPTRILNDSGASFHNVPYRTAVCWKVPLKGMFLASSAINFSLGDESNSYIISSINNHPTRNVIEGEKVLSKLKDRERVFVRYTHATTNTRPQTTHITIDRHWNQLTLTNYNPDTEKWEYSSVDTSDSTTASEPLQSPTTVVDVSSVKTSWLFQVKSRFVQITWIAPYVNLDEISETRLESFGFILHSGLAFAAKTTCPHDLCDIYIDIDGREVLGEIVHMDDRQNWVLVRYDPTNTSTESLDTIQLATEIPQELDTLTFVGMDGADIFHTAKATVTGTFIAEFLSPLQHAEVLDVVQIDGGLAHFCLFGVVLNESQQVAGFWLVMKNNGRYALPATGIAAVVPKILAGDRPKSRKRFNFRLDVIPPKNARVIGVADEYIRDGIRANGAQHRFFSVRRATREVAEYIRHGDVLLSINGKRIQKYTDFDSLEDTEKETAELLIVRDGKEMVVDFPLKLATDVSTDRVTCIFGMVFQRPYTDIKYITQHFPSELIFTCAASGSPGQQALLPYNNFVVAVNGKRIHDRDSFLGAVKKVPDETDFTIQSEDWNGKEYSDIVRKTSRAFGSSEFVKENGKWKKVPLRLEEFAG